MTTATDLVYAVTGVHDRAQGVHLAFACGGSYGEMSVRGAGYANVQYNEICSAHYPRYVQYMGNYCRDGRQDFSETGIDQGGPCP